MEGGKCLVKVKSIENLFSTEDAPNCKVLRSPLHNIFAKVFLSPLLYKHDFTLCEWCYEDKKLTQIAPLRKLPAPDLILLTMCSCKTYSTNCYKCKKYFS